MIRQPSSESDFEEVNEDGDDELDLREKTSNLSKIAEAAGRKMKKLKTNWSMKKNDITRSLSKIKRPSRASQGEGGEGRRKLVRRLSSTGAGLGSVGQSLGLELPDDDTMFYITLTIEEEGKEPINITTGSSGDSDMDSTTYSHLSTDSSTAGTTSKTTSNPPPPHRRKSSCSRPYSVVRPLVPPPAPPTSIINKTSTTSSSSFEGQDRLMVNPSSQEESQTDSRRKVSGQESKTHGGQQGQATATGGSHKCILNVSNVSI